MRHTDGNGNTWKVRRISVVLWWLSNRVLDVAEWLNCLGNRTDTPR